MDIHNHRKVVEYELQQIEKDEIPREEKVNLKKYYKELLAKGISYGRIAKYLRSIRKLSQMLRKPFSKATKEDFIELVAKIEKNPKWTEWTKHDFKVVLRRYYRWLKGLSDKDPFPEEVRWISINVRNANNKLPKDILTFEEVQKIAQVAYNKRDKAFVITLFESGARIGEILPLKIKDLEFNQDFCKITLRGKTGDRRLKLILSYKPLVEWLEEHPNKNNPEAFVWINFNDRRADKPISYGFIRKLLKELAAKAGVKKKVNPHAFRHASATWRANYFTESQLKEFYGWAQSSRMASTYVHLAGRDLDNAVDKMFGIENKEEKQKLIPFINCPRCNEQNDLTVRFCKKCGLPLDMKELDRMEKFEDLLIEFFKILGEVFPQAKEKFVEIAKRKGMLSLFKET
jgi:site-specific recombinase XerD